MKLNKTILAIFFALTCTCSVNAFADYKTKSIFSADYKCVSEEMGGFNHSASGHNLTRFKGEEEFFLTHISNIPDEAIVDLNTMIKVSNNDVSKIRELLESRLMKQEKITDTIITEDSSYFIREPRDDPREGSTYISNGCSSFKSQKQSSIRCYISDSLKTFILDLETMRFTYSYAGTWHNKKDDYYGDSSVFVFGTCKEYYR